jgi:hypothetical protein
MGAGNDPIPLAQAVYERMQGIGARAGIPDLPAAQTARHFCCESSSSRNAA